MSTTYSPRFFDLKVWEERPSWRETLDDVTFFDRRLPGGRRTVKKGFRYNGFSRLVKSPWSRRFRAAGLIHDELYRSKVVDRQTADAIMRSTLKRDGVGRIKRWSYWAAVRAGGGRRWRTMGAR